jgi:hypothetical protein
VVEVLCLNLVFMFLGFHSVRVGVVSWGPPTILTCLVKGSMSEQDYTLACFMAFGVREGTLVVPVAYVSAVETAVLHQFGKLTPSCWQQLGGQEWCRAMVIIFKRGGLVVQAMRVSSCVVTYLGCGDRESFDGGGVHVVKWCRVGWSDGFLWCWWVWVGYLEC